MLHNRDDIIVGEHFRVYGTPLHDGDTITVVDWSQEWDKLPSSLQHKAKFISEKTLIPCYNSRYPHTKYWWIAPWQLKRIIKKERI